MSVAFCGHSGLCVQVISRFLTSVDSTMGDQGTQASSVTRLFSRRELGSVVQALRGDFSNTLPVVSHGSECTFCVLQRIGRRRQRIGRRRQSDVMNQLVTFKVRVEQGKDCFEFEPVWDVENLVSISLLEAMQTNKTVRSLVLIVNSFEESHLAAIVCSLLKNDTLQSFFVRAYCDNLEQFLCLDNSTQTLRAAFKEILDRNMCLRSLQISHVVRQEDDAGELIWSRVERVDLGPTVAKAIERNRQAFAVAEELGRVSKSCTLCYPDFGDIEFRRELLLFFLAEGCQPPRMMLSVAKGLPKY